MAIFSLKFVDRPCGQAKWGLPANPCPKGSKCGSRTRAAKLTKKGLNVPNIRPHSQNHPDTPQDLADTDIHANHLEGFNSGIRRKLACYRRRTNTYAKQEKPLQTRPDVHWILHNFAWPHFTTRQVPAVALNILERGLSMFELFNIRYI